MGVLYTQALADRAQVWLDLPLADKRSPAGLLELATIWAAINRAPLPDCTKQCQYSERARVVRNYVFDFPRFQNSEPMSDSKYMFAPAYASEQIADERYGKVVTTENLDDKDAEALIKMGYGHVIVKKGAADKAAAGTDGKPEASETETKAKEAEGKAKADLKTEKDAHTATKKELTATKGELAKVQKQLADVQKDLTDAQAKVTELSKPAPEAPAETPQA